MFTNAYLIQLLRIVTGNQKQYVLANVLRYGSVVTQLTSDIGDQPAVRYELV